MIMETALMTWYGVVTLICAIVLAKLITIIAHRHHHNHQHKAIHIVKLSNEREMLYVPGDVLDRDGIDNDYNSDEQ